MRIGFVGALAIGLASFPSIALGQPSDVLQLIQDWRIVNSVCRPSTGANSDVCKERASLYAQLEAKGYCYGRAGEVGYRMRWHVCVADSIRMSANAQQQQPSAAARSLRQERTQVRTQLLAEVTEISYCIGYFDIKGDAAEMYELQVAPTQREARHFLSKVQFLAAFVQEPRAFVLLLVERLRADELSAFAGDYGEFFQEVEAARNAGLKRGESDARGARVDAVRRQYEACTAFVDEDVPMPPPSSATVPTKPVDPPSAPAAPNLAAVVPPSAPAAPNLAAVVTASEIEGVRQKIRPCWNTQGGSRDQAMIISLTVEMNQNGTPIKAEPRDMARYNSDPVFRAAADAAYRAIMDPRCQPWPLSPEKFQAWRFVAVNFDPRDY